jgi:hypothetical protein
LGELARAVRKTGLRLQTSGVRKRDKSLFKKELGKMKIFLFFSDFGQNRLRALCDVERRCPQFLRQV